MALIPKTLCNIPVPVVLSAKPKKNLIKLNSNRLNELKGTINIDVSSI
jgi:hypothetical protein